MSLRYFLTDDMVNYCLRLLRLKSIWSCNESCSYVQMLDMSRYVISIDIMMCSDAMFSEISELLDLFCQAVDRCYDFCVFAKSSPTTLQPFGLWPTNPPTHQPFACRYWLCEPRWDRHFGSEASSRSPLKSTVPWSQPSSWGCIPELVPGQRWADATRTKGTGSLTGLTEPALGGWRTFESSVPINLRKRSSNSSARLSFRDLHRAKSVSSAASSWSLCTWVAVRFVASDASAGHISKAVSAAVRRPCSPTQATLMHFDWKDFEEMHARLLFVCVWEMLELACLWHSSHVTWPGH